MLCKQEGLNKFILQKKADFWESAFFFVKSNSYRPAFFHDQALTSNLVPVLYSAEVDAATPSIITFVNGPSSFISIFLS